MPKQEAVALHSAVKRSLEKFISRDHCVEAALMRLAGFISILKKDDLITPAAQSSQSSFAFENNIAVDHDHVISSVTIATGWILEVYCGFCFIS